MSHERRSHGTTAKYTPKPPAPAPDPDNRAHVARDPGKLCRLDDFGVTAKDAFLRRFLWEGGHGDVWRIFDDGVAFRDVVTGMVEPWRGRAITKVCGIESRGFILGGAVAGALGVGFAAIRKHGNLFPGPKHEIQTRADYRGARHVLQIQERSVRHGDHVLLVDDWIERGSQAAAARDLIEMCGGVLTGITVMVDQLDDHLRADGAAARWSPRRRRSPSDNHGILAPVKRGRIRSEPVSRCGAPATAARPRSR